MSLRWYPGLNFELTPDVISVPWSNLVGCSIPLSLVENRSLPVCPVFSTAKKKTKCPAVVTQFLRLMTESPWTGGAFSKFGQVMGWRSCGTSLQLGCIRLPTRLLRPRVLRDTKFWASAVLQPLLSPRLPHVTCVWLMDQWTASFNAGFWCWKGVTVLWGGARVPRPAERGQEGMRRRMWISHLKCGTRQVC